MVLSTRIILRSIKGASLYFISHGRALHVHQQHCYASLRVLCISVDPAKNTQEKFSQAILWRKLDTALESHDVLGAWEAHCAFKRVFGYPDSSVTNKLLNKLLYSSDPKWLQKACDLVFSVVKRKPNYFQCDLLTKLALSLARAQMPFPLSMVLRMMLEKENLPHADMLALIILHMVKTEIGTYLASNFLFEICDSIKSSNSKKSSCKKLATPSTLIFNLVLDACTKFRSFFKGQEIIESMARVGATADAHSINIIARTHEINGRRDELMKLKEHIDQVSISLLQHYRQFYDSLLSLHFKFNDIDAAAGLILEMYQVKKSLPVHKERGVLEKHCLVTIGSNNMKAGLRLRLLPERLPRDSVLQVKSRGVLVLYKDGKLFLSRKALAKLVLLYKRYGRINEFTNLLVCIQKLDSSEKKNLCSDVIDACIELGWLDIAHDILEDMGLEGLPADNNLCVSLVTAYYKVKKFREAESLLKHIESVGLNVNIPEIISSEQDSSIKDECSLVIEECTSTVKSDLAEFIAREMKREEKALSSVVYELNSSIYFFMKAKMVGDAKRTYQKMQVRKICPTVATFMNLINGYSALEMYREITFLWGDIKRNITSGNLVVSRDLFESLLLNFLRGGYFERLLEIINYMKENGMYMDKSFYKSEYLKLHKDLYRHLKADDAKTEAQQKRLEHVLAFKEWAGIK